MRSSLLITAALLLAPVSARGQAPAYFESVGYNDLVARLTAAALTIPTGAGITVAQIEAETGMSGSNRYVPGAAATAGKTLNDMSGGGLVSGHATNVGRRFYGDLSMATGIATVNAYRIGGAAAGDWYGSAYLNVGTGFAPVVTTDRVQNHSYIAVSDTPDDPIFVEGMRRLDFAIKRDNIVAVVGVHNIEASPIPALFGNSYNTIAVGRTNGVSSHGPTTADVVGRSKPDIVVPLGNTSNATAVVSAAAALLLETADSKSDAGEAARAGRAETIKAALLAGATKEEFAGLGTPWTRDTVTVDGSTFTRPLDIRFGAGELNINNSHLILGANEQNGTDTSVDARYGWDHETFTGAGDVRRYFIDVPDNAIDVSLSAVATWLRDIPQTGPLAGQATLSEVHLKLYEADSAFTLISLIDQSVSPIDNVQHVHAIGLTPGRRYAIEVTLASLPLGQLSEDVAIAWRTEYDLTPIPEPTFGLLVGLAAVVAVRRRSTSGNHSGIGSGG